MQIYFSLYLFLFSYVVVLIAEIGWSSWGIVWLHDYYITCSAGTVKEILLGESKYFFPESAAVFTYILVA